MKILYDVDITSKGTSREYSEGKLIPWDSLMSYTSKTKAIKCSQESIGLGNIVGSRVVQIDDCEDKCEPKDIFVGFVD
jgi:hypothetical protein